MNRIFNFLAVARNFVLPLVAAVLALAHRVAEAVIDFLNGDVAKAIAQFDKANGKLDRARMSAVRRANKIDDQIEALLANVDALEATYDATIGDAERAARIQARIKQLLG